MTTPGFAQMIRIFAMALALLVAPSAFAKADQVWVEMAPGDGSVARLVTAADTCPMIRIDGQARPMTLRSAPGADPVRPNKAHEAVAAVFASRVCEAPLPRGVQRAAIGGRALPLPRAVINRIVVIGDTGCRMKAADKAFQGCNDPAQWPFAAIAARAAALRPDLVLHVGDYLYRENPCPADHPACAATPWGYGEDSWRADFLDPAASLLSAAPWVMVRGNHEECARGGQGWWRLIAPQPLAGAAGCSDPARDFAGNHADPYRVDLGQGAGLVVADFAAVAGATDPATHDRLAADMALARKLMSRDRVRYWAAHMPVNPVLWADGAPGAVQAGPVQAISPVPDLPARAMFAGHIHTFQVARYADRPTQVITGFSGTLEDAAAAPASMAEARGKPGAEKLRALTTLPDRYGYALLERGKRGAWWLTAYTVDGTKLGRFPI